jgi:hypothetical protein
MVPDLFAVCLLVLGLGLVLGYLLAMPRVKVTEKALEKAQLRVSELEMALDRVNSQAMWQ